MTSRKIIALLPMKAHSERVANKNFRTLCGKPMFRWMLDTLLAIDEINRVVINTDACDILRANGLDNSQRVLIRERKPALCGDEVSMNLVLADDITAVAADLYLMTHTTNPLLSQSSIRAAIAVYDRAVANNAADSLFSVSRHQTRFYRGDGSAINHDPDELVRTQDLEPWFEENSNLYLFTRASFAHNNARIGAAPMLFESPKHESIDIDDWDDWAIAEGLLARAAGSGTHEV